MKFKEIKSIRKIDELLSINFNSSKAMNWLTFLNESLDCLEEKHSNDEIQKLYQKISAVPQKIVQQSYPIDEIKETFERLKIYIDKLINISLKTLTPEALEELYQFLNRLCGYSLAGFDDSNGITGGFYRYEYGYHSARCMLDFFIKSIVEGFEKADILFNEIKNYPHNNKGSVKGVLLALVQAKQIFVAIILEVCDKMDLSKFLKTGIIKRIFPPEDQQALLLRIETNYHLASAGIH